MTNPETLLTATEAAERLGWKNSQLDSDRKRHYETGLPPKVRFYHLPSDVLRYRLGDVLAVKEMVNKGPAS